MAFRVSGGLFFSLLMDAKLPISKKENLLGRKSRTTQPMILQELTQITESKTKKDLPVEFPKQIVSSYSSCHDVSSPTYLTFQLPAVAAAFDQRIKANYASVLQQFECLCAECFLPAALPRIGRILLLLVEKDESISDHLYVTPDGCPLSRQDVLCRTEFYFPALALGMWHYCVTKQIPNTNGQEAFLALFTHGERNHVWKLRKHISGEKDESDIHISTELEQTFLSASSSVVNELGDNPPVIVVPDELVVPDQNHSWVDDYLENIKVRYSSLKTLLYHDALVSFYDFYVCNRVILEKQNRNGGISLFNGIGLFDNEDQDSCDKDHCAYEHDAISDISAEKLLALSRRVILRGTGGIGKSMMIRHLLLNAIDDVAKGGPIPVCVFLKDYRGRDNLDSIIVRSVCEFTNMANRSVIEQHLKEGRFLILFDGLDEIVTKARPQFEAQLTSFANRYRKNAFVLSSRPISNFVSYSQFCVLNLLPLTKQQSLCLIDRLVFRPDDPTIKKKFANALDTHLYDSHRSFASNPLLLNIMLMTFERYADVPAKMHKFYEKAYAVLSEEHDASKGAYTRVFETGLDSDKLLSYLAEFCARSYVDEQFKITQRKARDYFNALNSKEADGENAPMFSAFMHDICDNLCIMYRENDTYYFIHRSFQEYFSALYFSWQLDEDLLAVCEELESKRYRSSVDSTLDMLYEMIPEKLQRFVFYPWLGQFFSETDSIECYWNFIDRVFDGIPYSYDEVGTYGPSSAPRSAVYDYITSKFNLVDNIRYDFGDFGFPLLEEFIETTYYKGTAYVDDQGEITEVFPEGEDEFSNYVFDHTEKCGYIIHFYMKDLHKYLLDEKKPYNPDSYCEEVGEILQIVNSKDFPLRREYDSVRRYFLQLKARYESPRKKGNLFDRLKH